MKEVERMNVVVVYLQQWAEFVLRYDPYIMDIDYKRNHYNCRGFRHVVKYCRKWDS